jgi:glutamyl-tRNA synthetase
LLAWLFARASGRAFRLRVEDLDAARIRPGMAERQQQDLAALGLTFDGVPMVQSARSAAYRQALARLADRTYECFCSRREIAEATLAPHGELRHYPGTCRALTDSERERRRQTRTPALRVRADGAVQTVLDQLRGRVTRPVDDFVVQRNDGVAAYMLAVVVDDAAMGVDQVVRGDDLLAAAPDQAWLATVLGLPVPTYAHVPLVLNAAGGRLAKRDGAVTLTDLTAAGVGSAAVLGMLATSLGLAAPGEPVTVELLLDRFDSSQLPTDPWLWEPRNVTPVVPTEAEPGGSDHPAPRLRQIVRRPD